MMKCIVVGNLGKSYLKTGIAHYEKQITPSFVWIEVKDEAQPSGMSVEASRIFKHIGPNDYVIALAIKGVMLDSEAFAKKLDALMTYEQKNITFVIGGSYGLDPSVLDRADFKLSMSKMTFPHQMMRLILIEQIYRAMMILKHHPYHK
ncbi:MAG: 23S rRNA (pseudouridine(1915)-N(3))-methyltransferase RlmH [Acholeplasmataceae bacterium]|jgi:23S rRNA (pseudouridine1915-N3)-methyltransferase